jgi:glycine/serine hydroxymethyltransferase
VDSQLRIDRTFPEPLGEGFAATLIADALAMLVANERLSRQVINLVASENFQSPVSRLPLLFDGYNRYYFRGVGNDNDYGFRGAARPGVLERELAIPLLQRRLGTEYLSVRPLSGLSAMAIVVSALGGAPGDACLTLGGRQGGHSVTGPLTRRFGLVPSLLPGAGPHAIDLVEVTKLCAEVRPKLIYLDQSNALFPYLDVRALGEAARAACPEVVIHVDCSHWLGLILAGQLPNPLDVGADTISGSSHKSFAGPHKGFIATRSADRWAQLLDAQTTFISSHHFGAAVSFALALVEHLDPGAQRTLQRVVPNAQALGAELHKRNVPVFGEELGFTGSHQLWVDPDRAGVPPQLAAERMFAAGIRITNLPSMPGVNGPALRLGIQEATWLGFDAADAPELADLMADAMTESVPPTAIAQQVAAMRARWRERQPAQRWASDELLAEVAEMLGGSPIA